MPSWFISPTPWISSMVLTMSANPDRMALPKSIVILSFLSVIKDSFLEVGRTLGVLGLDLGDLGGSGDDSKLTCKLVLLLELTSLKLKLRISFLRNPLSVPIQSSSVGWLILIKLGKLLESV